MIKLKDKPAELIASKQANIRAGKGGIIPPVEHRFQPGVSGNPGGRPKLLTEAMSKILAQPAEVIEVIVDGDKLIEKKRIGTKAEQIAANLANEASRGFVEKIAAAQLGAAQELRRVAEPTEKEEADAIASTIHSAILAGFLRMAQMKPAEAIEV